MAIQTYSFSYTDLTPLLDKAKENTSMMAAINDSINNTWVHDSKTPSQWDHTVWENSPFKVNSVNKELDKLITENQNLYKQYRSETDRRNSIINRMNQLRQNIKYRYESDINNRLASINMIKRDIQEHRKLRQEVNKFLKNIKRNK